MIRIPRILLLAGLSASLVFPAAAVQAQTATPQSRLMRQLSRVDFGVSGMGSFATSVTGTVPHNGAPDAGTTVSESASNTLGALINLRYVAKPYIGVEFNYTYARYTETFNVAPLQIQTGVDEASFGYLITPPHPVFGLQPFASVGAGSTRFRPTAGGGQSVLTQWRATYYYSLGLQKEIGHSGFGVRGAFRENFLLAPDFLENYLTIQQRTHTIQPTVGVYFRF